MTRLMALLGDPVAHSLSPRLQNAAFRELGLDGVYVALRTSAEDLPGLLRGITRSGGGGNVTLPHKERAARAVEVRSLSAARTGAVNTFWEEGGRIHGDNTDVAGCRVAIESLVSGGGIQGGRVLLLGAGGASRAAILALEALGAREIGVWSRSPARARAMVGSVRPVDLRIQVVEEPFPDDGPGRSGPGADPRWISEGFTLVINATPRGLRADDPLPLSLDALPPASAVLDLVYRPEETRWIREARRAGHRAADGGIMLVEQGMAAFERWWGQPAPAAVFHDELARIRREAGLHPGVSGKEEAGRG